MHKYTIDFCKAVGAGAAASAISIIPVTSYLGITGDNGAGLISLIGAAAFGITARALNIVGVERPSKPPTTPNYDEYKK